MRFKKEWFVVGKSAGTGKWDVVVNTKPDGQKTGGYQKLQSMEDAIQEMHRLRAEENFRIHCNQGKPEPDSVIDWKVSARLVSSLFRRSEKVAENLEPEALLERACLCMECGSDDCVFNDEGICRYSLVHGVEPQVSDADGCTDGYFPGWTY